MIELTRPVTRRVVSHKGSPLVARFTPDGIYFREPKKRTWYGPLDYGRLFMTAVKGTVELRRAQKGGKRRSPRRLRGTAR